MYPVSRNHRNECTNKTGLQPVSRPVEQILGLFKELKNLAQSDVNINVSNLLGNLVCSKKTIKWSKKTTRRDTVQTQQLQE